MPSRDPAVLLDTEHAVARVLAGGADPPAVYERLLEAIGSALAWELAAAWEVAADGQDGAASRCGARRGSAAGASWPRRARCGLARGEGLPGRVWATGRPARIADLARRPELPARRLRPPRGPAVRVVLPGARRRRRDRRDRAVRVHAPRGRPRAAADDGEPRPPDRPGGRARPGRAGAARQHGAQERDPRRRLRLRHHDGRRRPGRRGQPRHRAHLRLPRRPRWWGATSPT